MSKIDDLNRKLEDFFFRVLAHTVFLPFLVWQWIADRHYYRSQLFKFKRGDRFYVNKDTKYLSRNRIYTIEEIEGNTISFTNDKKWWDKINVTDVRKII